MRADELKLVVTVEQVEPRLMNRKNAALYMGRSVRKFDEIKHLFRVEDNGLILYDRVLMDRHVDLKRAA